MRRKEKGRNIKRVEQKKGRYTLLVTQSRLYRKQEVESHWSSVTVQHEQKTRHHAEEDTDSKNSFTFPKKQQNRSIRIYSSGLDPEPELFTERQNGTWPQPTTQIKTSHSEQKHLSG